MKITRRTSKGSNVLIYEAIECGKPIASGRSKSHLMEQLRERARRVAAAAAKKTA